MSCAHDNIFVMDYIKYRDKDGMLTIFRDGSMPEVKITNRVCSKCSQHWFGHDDRVAEYTAREWDKYLNDSL